MKKLMLAVVLGMLVQGCLYPAIGAGVGIAVLLNAQQNVERINIEQVETEYPLPVPMTLSELQQRNEPLSLRHFGR